MGKHTGSVSKRRFKANPINDTKTPTLGSRKRSTQDYKASKVKQQFDADSRARVSEAQANRCAAALDIPDNFDSDNDTNIHTLQDILDGSATIDFSHAGGEFGALLNEETGSSGGFVSIDPGGQGAKKPKRRDPRTRRDRLELQNKGFEAQMESMVEAYMLWHSKLDPVLRLESAVPQPAAANAQGVYRVWVLDIYRTYSFDADMLPGDKNIVSSLLRNGLVPSSPFTPAYAVTVRTLESYRCTHLRCPHLSIEPFVKGLCDVYGQPYRTGLRKAFSSCLDVYLRLRDETSKLVELALHRSGTWRRRNACSACTYRLKGEVKLLAAMLTTMDGNDSLKRILRRAQPEDILDEATDNIDEGTSKPPSWTSSIEREDSRPIHGDYYLSPAETEPFSKSPQVLFPPKAKEGTTNEGGNTSEEENLCAGRWQNMANEVTAKMWGIFDETGIFLSLCRHGFVLVFSDMVRSGELAKYPLSIVNALLEAYGEGIVGGYDIGCKFGTTLTQSMLGPEAKRLDYKSAVGSFHGHAHNRLCQLSFLPLYTPGVGLEDFEGCERFFSRSNALASQLRYSSVFHRRQKIVEFMRHMDTHETEQALSKFLVNNYKQALIILASEPQFKQSMKDHGIEDTATFSQWLSDEREYLKNLAKEPIHETLQMEYYQKLVNLEAAQRKVETFNTTTWIEYNPLTPKGTQKAPPTALKRWHAEKSRDQLENDVQRLEVELGIEAGGRWTKVSPGYQEAAVLVSRRRYQRCLDELERLVVSRIFELTKVNMSQTGYKLRKHIAKALKARSQAIKSALARYNEAASKMRPPRQQLTWERVVEYAFLADFDLLRDTRQNVADRPWASPASRTLMDQYFKIERAREEIERLNIEIRRVVTHIRDEEAYLKCVEEAQAKVDKVLAHHIRCYRAQRLQYSALHLSRFEKLKKFGKSFTGTLHPGTSLDDSRTTHKSLDTMDVDSEVQSRGSKPWGDEGDGVDVAEGNSGKSVEGDAAGTDDDDSEDDSDDERDYDVAYQTLTALTK